MTGESIDGRACIVCGAHLTREHVHRHELPGWKMRYADLEGALEGYETVALGCPADTPMGSCVPRCGAQMCEEAAQMEDYDPAIAWRDADREMLREEIERLRAALRQIADANSGRWGWIAHEALHPKAAQTSETHRPLEGQ